MLNFFRKYFQLNFFLLLSFLFFLDSTPLFYELYSVQSQLQLILINGTSFDEQSFPYPVIYFYFFRIISCRLYFLISFSLINPASITRSRYFKLAWASPLLPLLIPYAPSSSGESFDQPPCFVFFILFLICTRFHNMLDPLLIVHALIGLDDPRDSTSTISFWFTQLFFYF